MKYQYVGMTKDRQRVTGQLDAKDESEAQLRLRAMQIRPEKLSAATAAAAAAAQKKKKVTFTLGSPVTLKELMLFMRQFSSLIDSGVAIVQCLDLLARQQRNKAFKQILINIKEDIEAGNGLAEAMMKYPKCFSEFLLRVVEAGEMSGTLDKALRRAGQQLEKLSRLKSKVIGALIYPIITVVLAVGILIFLLIKVIPTVAQLYGKAKLPELTQDVLDLSKYVQGHFVSGAAYLIGGIIFSVLLYRQKKFREVFDPLYLKIPLFGSLAVRSGVARFSRTMSMLLSSGVPLLNAFEVCQKLMSNLAIRKCIADSKAAVSEGKGMAHGLAQSKVFPEMVIHMVSIGEVTGRLDELLGKVADIYDEEVDDAVSAITGLLQPALIVIVGILIAFLLLAMYMPIFTLGEHAAG